MKLKDIGNEIDLRHTEIYNRIEKYFDKFKYATYTSDYWNFDNWLFESDGGIVILMSCGYGNDFEQLDTSIDSEFLETDEVFEKWINDKLTIRNNVEAKLKAKHKLNKDKEDFKKYQELKAKFEKQ